MGSFQPVRFMAMLPGRRADARGFGRHGVSVCVGSNFDSRLPRCGTGLSELQVCVDSLVISSEVGYRKPHPDFLRFVCNHLGLARARGICVGDDSENDVRGAIRAGLPAFLIDRGGNRPADLRHVPVLTALVEMKFVQKRPNSRLQSR